MAAAAVRRPAPPLIGRITGALFGASWLGWLAYDLVARRRGKGVNDAAGYAGLGLSLLAPVLSHRNRVFGRLPHHTGQKALVGTGVALDWAALGLAAADSSAGPLSPRLLFGLGMALILESPFVFVVLTLPAAWPLLRRLAGR